MNKKHFLAGLCLIVLSETIYGQQLDSLIGKFEQHRENTMQEKVYAHVDRTFYLTGEILWFKLYVVDGTIHQPLDVSKVAYAEVLDAGNFAVLQAKIGLDQGMGNGSFFIPASLSSGNYRFRVYTNWMKNFPPEYYFEQAITIVNPFIAPEARNGQATPCRIDFFPEGGNLVSDLESKVGFKIYGGSGNETACPAYILSDINDTLATLTPDKSGLGHFYFTPEKARRYRAVVRSQTGTSIHALPEVHNAGYVMHLNDDDNRIEIRVRAKDMSQPVVYLFAHARQVIVRAERQELHNNVATFQMPAKDLPDGITHFTVFDANLQPVCERLYFIHPRRKLQVNISTNQKAFLPRKKVSVTLETKNQNSIPGTAHLSMAVYRMDSLPQPERAGILSYLWLQSDLSGVVELPEFHSDRVEDKSLMDNLMLTRGWRRFDWKDVLEKRHDYKFLPEVRGHIVTGIVSKGGRRQRGVFTYLGSPGKIIRAYGSWSNEEGIVRFEIKDFYGPRRIIIQARTDSAEAYTISVSDPFSSLMNRGALPEWRLGTRHARNLLARSIAMQVQDIYYFDTYGNRTLLPEVDSTAFYGEGDNTYYLDDYTRFPVMEEVMREYVPGVFVRKRKDGFHFIVIDKVKGGVLPGEPMVLLDGVPVLDVDNIMAVDPRRIRKLEVVGRQYHLGQAVFFGIVSYTTYQGDLGGMELDPRSLSLNYDGLQLRREFHSPQYSREQTQDRLPDQRWLLHWEPDIATDENGKKQIEFFTSDIPGVYLVVVEGLNQEGEAGSQSFTFTVTPSENQ